MSETAAAMRAHRLFRGRELLQARRVRVLLTVLADAFPLDGRKKHPLARDLTPFVDQLKTTLMFVLVWSSSRTTTPAATASAIGSTHS